MDVATPQADLDREKDNEANKNEERKTINNEAVVKQVTAIGGGSSMFHLVPRQG